MLVAVIGCGRRTGGKEGFAIGYGHAKAWLAARPDAQLVAVDIVEANLQAFGEHFSLPQEQLFRSTDALYAAGTPDYVSICTWPALHAPQTIMAARAGARGIICEKPLALHMGEIAAMRAACDQHNTRLAVAHQRRLEGVFQLARQLLHSGSIGDSWVLEARVGEGWDMLSWTTHWFDMANFLLAANPTRLLAGLDYSGQRRYGHAVENSSVVFVEYDNAAQALFVTGPDTTQEAAISIRGSKGLLLIGANSVEVYNQSGYQLHSPDLSGPQSYTALVLELIAAVERGTPMTCDAANCAIATEMAFAAQESARTMTGITLPLAARYAPLEVAQRPPRPALPTGKVVLLADNHFDSGGREGLAEALAEETGQAPTLLEAHQGLTAEALADAGTLVLYHTHPTADEQTQQVLRSWVAAGKPLVLVHAALGAYPAWEEYRQWAGRVWVWDGPEPSIHPYSECWLEAATTANWSWQSAWLPEDEIFARLGSTGACTDLLWAVFDEERVPAAWLNTNQPNVAVWVPGHRRDMWRLPTMRSGLLALINRVQRRD
jgi:predicted dehydrogenase